MAKYAFEYDDDALVAAVATLDDKIDRALSAIILRHAPLAEAYAKRNAPWTDRTTNARNGLFGKPERDRPRYRIIIAHAVPYGIWLEVKYSGRYAIIMPTVNHEGPEVMKTVSGLFGMLGRGV